MEVLLVLTISFFMPLVLIHAAAPDSASVQLINLLGDPVTATCVADNGSMSRGASAISPMGSQEWAFDGGVLSVGWACHFEWADSSDCAQGTCKVHTQDVKVWQGVMGRRKLAGANIAQLTPCAACIWQIKFDGFYRADTTDLVYTFIVGWN